MKKIYTSCYGMNGANPNAISISYIIPSYYEGKSMAKLAPTMTMITRLKSWVLEGEYSEEDYRKDYINLLENRDIDAEALIEELPDGAILLCYEGPDEFCHRHVLAEWIQQQTGVVVEECEAEREMKKNEQNKIVDSLVGF